MTDEEMRGAYCLAQSYRHDAVLEGNWASRLPEGSECEQLTADVTRWAQYAEEHEARAAELEKTHENRSARPPWPRARPEPSEELRWAWHDLEQARRAHTEPNNPPTPRLQGTSSRLRNVHQRVNLLEANEGRSDTVLGEAELARPQAMERLREIMSRP